MKELKQLTSTINHLIQTHLWLKILVAAGLGVILGSYVNHTSLMDSTIKEALINWTALPGNIFLALIQMVMVPLVFASIILGINSSGGEENLKSIGLKSGLYFLFTTTISIVIGIFIAYIIKPGKFISSTLIQTMPTTSDLAIKAMEKSNLPNLILNILPNNPLNSIVQGQMFEIVIFSILMGVALVGLSLEFREPLLKLMSSLQQVSMKIVGWAMKLAPIAVFGLLFKLAATVGLQLLNGLGAYILTVVLGLLAVIAFYMIILVLVTKRNPFQFLSQIKGLQLLAFSTSSSASVMPLSIQTAEDKLKVKKSVSQFIIPLGATVNMDGTALYQGVATLFLAQVYNVPLSFMSLALVVVTAVGASVGTPGTPGIGIVILASILESVGIPASGIALIIGVDRLLDMGRTVVNVTGDLTACCVLDTLTEE